MAGLTVRSFDSADEVRTPDKTKLDVVNLAGVKAMRMTVQPGWTWSECIKPVAGTERCQAHHVGVMISGTLHIAHDDGTAADVGPGEAYVVEPGHDAWVVGDQPCVAYEFDSTTASTFAKS